MRPLTTAVVASLALLAGCSSPRSGPPPAAPPPPQVAAAQPPVDIMGTWTERSGGGFIAIGARQIVVAVDGAPRSVAAVQENAIEPGMAAGRLGLADGSALYLARGSTLIDGVPVDHLDVEIVHAGAAGVRRRLLSESGLRLAARLAQPVVKSPAPSSPDSVFLAAVPESRRAAAEHLVSKASAGSASAELANSFAARQRSAYADVLVLLEQVGAQPAAAAAERFREADSRRADAERFALAWQAWMAGRG